MKLKITEEQVKRLNKTLLREQDDSTIGTLYNFFNSLNGENGQPTNNDTNNGDTNYDLGSSKDLKDLVKIVIDKLEGGYYHPDMLLDGRVKDRRYNRSGETMFGMDRKNGGSINTSSAGRQFWSLIDNANARQNWKWNYGGGNLRPQLLDLASQMIIPKYQEYLKKYLSPQAQNIVNSDKKLTFNFLYATWNGEGRFKKFANKINDAVSQGNTSSQSLSNIALNSRTQTSNSLISQQTKTINNIMNKLT